MCRLITMLCLFLLPPRMMAQSEPFNTGPVFKDFGAHAPVAQNSPVSAESRFRIVFDVSQPAGNNQRNRPMESAARFINMHVANGVPAEHIQLAVVVHGQAVKDLVKASDGAALNEQMKMVQMMLKQGVQFHVCGQSAAYYGVTKGDLLAGVNMALSAMTVHAQLQQQGYTLNPF